MDIESSSHIAQFKSRSSPQNIWVLAARQRKHQRGGLANDASILESIMGV
jgi:hypothetical protein